MSDSIARSRMTSDTKKSLKEICKRGRTFSIYHVSFIFLVVGPSLAFGQSFNDFRMAHQDDKTLDLSSLKTCWGLNGKIELVESGNKNKGSKCDCQVPNYSKTQREALDVCKSRVPYHILEAQPAEAGDKATTSCSFLISLACETGYWQVHGKCYRLFPGKFNWIEAQAICNNQQVSADYNPAVANYYSSLLHNYFLDMVDVYDAWVTVSDLKDFFVNGDGHSAVYVQNSAYKYETRSGAILMFPPNSKHQVICEYAPQVTLAEMYQRAKIYQEIYPVGIYDQGAIIPTYNYRTITQEGLVAIQDQLHYGGFGEKFNVKEFSEVCENVGNILGIKSYPMTSIEEEHTAIKHLLTDHHFYLTTAYKNDGCAKSDYKDQDDKVVFTSSLDNDYCHAHSFCFHKDARYPAMAAMRGPIICGMYTYDWSYDKCADPPAWSLPPIRYNRTSRHICHYIDVVNALTYNEAKKACDDFGSSLSGFDSIEEFRIVQAQLAPYSRLWSNGVTIDDHYWLGGQSPCQNDCAGGRQVASWNQNTAVNTTFLNNYEHRLWNWELLPDGHGGFATQYVSFRKDIDALHIHEPHAPYPKMMYICGKIAMLRRSNRIEGGLKG